MGKIEPLEDSIEAVDAPHVIAVYEDFSIVRLDLKTGLRDSWSVPVVAVSIPIWAEKREGPPAKSRVPPAPIEGRVKEEGVVGKPGPDDHYRMAPVNVAAVSVPLCQRLRRPKGDRGEADTRGNRRTFGNHNETSKK